jgi:plastocyanin
MKSGIKKKIFTVAALLVLPLTIGARIAVRTAWADENSQTQTIEVKVDNFTFNPKAITVPVNSMVSWVNKDDIPHVVAGTDGSFKSKAMDTDQKYSYTFTKAGTYPYYCPIHPKMVGKIIVH